MKKIFLYISFVFSLGFLLNLFSITNVSAQEGICASPGTCIIGDKCPSNYVSYRGNCDIFITTHTCCAPQNQPSPSYMCSSPGTCIASTTCTKGYIPYPGDCTIFGNATHTCCQPENTSGNRLLKDKIFCVSSNPKGGTTVDPASGYIYTAIGCIPVTGTSEFIAWILGWAIGIGGGISLMLIVVASFQIISSSGNPEKVQAGKELLTSAIAGLIMLIFSVFILKIIGIDILKLPGLK